jgi:hypothetical protein
VIGAVRLSSGSIAILDALPAVVRVFDPTGRHLRNIGREGDGPGEFREPAALVGRGDTLVVLDQRGRRTRFSPTGTVLGTDPIALAGYCGDRHNARFGGLLPDASVVVRCEERLFGRVRGEYRQEVGVLRVRLPRGADTLGWFPADTGRTDPGGTAVPRPYLPRSELLWAAAGQRVFASPASTARIQVLQLDGRPVRFLQVPAQSRPARPADAEEAIAVALRSIANLNDRRVVGEWYAGMPRAERTPAVRSLVAAGEQELWIETWEREVGGSVWVVLDDNGRQLARVVAPPGSTLLSVGRDWSLWLWRDEFDVEHVRVHGLRR